MRLHVAKPMVGPCLSKALCIAPGKLPSEQPRSPGDKPACVLPVWPGALARSQADGGGAWEKHSATVQCYLQSCHGASKWLQHVRPLSQRSPGQRQHLGPHRTVRPASLQQLW